MMIFMRKQFQIVLFIFLKNEMHNVYFIIFFSHIIFFRIFKCFKRVIFTELKNPTFILTKKRYFRKWNILSLWIGSLRICLFKNN